uniref:Uncharacterized protein n=1 Tax=Lotus japonicus TaxID=34305 RepID=I3S3Z6_LOTJA|nr:unknown [Lotus japonicus]
MVARVWLLRELMIKTKLIMKQSNIRNMIKVQMLSVYIMKMFVKIIQTSF